MEPLPSDAVIVDLWIPIQVTGESGRVWWIVMSGMPGRFLPLPLEIEDPKVAQVWSWWLTRHWVIE